MRTVGIRQLKNKLSEYVRLVRSGETILVTDRGEAVAELGPPGRAQPESLRPGLAELVRRGLVSRLPSLPNSPDAYPRMPQIVPNGTAERVLDDIRGDR
jgi:antitoxin (DNA-binding transcriptional repressor) of toxin-antitoxin stability system